MMNNISLSQAESIAMYLYEHLKEINLIAAPIVVSESQTDKFGFSDNEKTPVLTIKFKNPQHGADFYREFMMPLSLNHEPPATDLTEVTIRLEITQEHPLLSNLSFVNSLFPNILRSIKENFIPHRR